MADAKPWMFELPEGKLNSVALGGKLGGNWELSGETDRGKFTIDTGKPLSDKSFW